MWDYFIAKVNPFYSKFVAAKRKICCVVHRFVAVFRSIHFVCIICHFVCHKVYKQRPLEGEKRSKPGLFTCPLWNVCRCLQRLSKNRKNLYEMLGVGVIKCTKGSGAVQKSSKLLFIFTHLLSNYNFAILNFWERQDFLMI